MNLGTRRLMVLAGFILVSLAAALGLRREREIPLPPHVSLPGMHPEIERQLHDFEQRVTTASDSSESWGEYGMALLAHQRVQESQQCLSQAQSMDPLSPRWPYYLGFIFSESDYETAERHWFRVLELDSKYLPARRRLMTLLMQQNRVSDAAKLLDETLKLGLEDGQTLLIASRIAQARGDREVAQTALDRARRMAPNSREVFTDSAAMARRAGDTASAMEYAKIAAGLPPAPLNDPWMAEVYALDASSRQNSMLADQLVQRGQYEQAAQLLERIHRQYPELARPAVNRVNLLLGAGQNIQAIQELELLQKQFPGDPLVQITMAFAQRQANSVEAAISCAREAVRLKPDFADAWVLLGQLYESRQEYQEALASYQQAVATEPRLAEAAQSLVRLRKLLESDQTPK